MPYREPNADHAGPVHGAAQAHVIRSACPLAGHAASAVHHVRQPPPLTRAGEPVDGLAAQPRPRPAPRG